MVALPVLVAALVAFVWNNSRKNKKELQMQDDIVRSYALNADEIAQLRTLNRISIQDVYTIKKMIQGERFPIQSARLSLNDVKGYLSKVLKRNLMSIYLFERLFGEMEQDDQGKVSALDMLLGLAMLTDATQSERLTLTFALLDSDEDGSITREELAHYIKIISTLGWCYDRKLLYKQTAKFPADFQRRTIKEMADECMTKANAHDDKISWQGFSTLPVQLT